MQKVAVIDRHASTARHVLLELVQDDELWSEVVAVARGRHVLGSYEYGDTNLFEWSTPRVRSERLQELADWLVYTCWIHERPARGE